MAFIDKSISTIITTQNAFQNLYEVSIEKTGIDLSPLSSYAESVTFGSGESIETVYNESTKSHSMKAFANSKTVTIDFKETQDYSVLVLFRSWMNKIYNAKENYFHQFNPHGKITIFADTPFFSSALPDKKIQVKITEAFPSQLSYPSYAWTQKEPIKIKVTFVFNIIEFTVPTL